MISISRFEQIKLNFEDRISHMVNLDVNKRANVFKRAEFSRAIVGRLLCNINRANLG